MTPVCVAIYARVSSEQQATSNTIDSQIAALEADAGRYFGYVRAVGRRRADAPVHEPVTSIPVQYAKKPLLRGEA